MPDPENRQDDVPPDPSCGACVSGVNPWHGHGDAVAPFARASRMAVDAKGYVWRVFPPGEIDPDDEMWSMPPVNPDNSPIPHPVTWYVPIEEVIEAVLARGEESRPSPDHADTFYAVFHRDCARWLRARFGAPDGMPSDLEAGRRAATADIVAALRRQIDHHDPNASIATVIWRDAAHLAQRVGDGHRD